MTEITEEESEIGLVIVIPVVRGDRKAGASVHSIEDHLGKEGKGHHHQGGAKRENHLMHRQSRLDIVGETAMERALGDTGVLDLAQRVEDINREREKIKLRLARRAPRLKGQIERVKLLKTRTLMGITLISRVNWKLMRRSWMIESPSKISHL